jgi:hypothetical protein
VEHDCTDEVAIYEAGPVRYSVNLRDDGGTKRKVVIRSGGQSCQDEVDLSSETQRVRFSGNATKRIGISAANIAVHLAALWSGVQAREDARDQGPTFVVSPDERALGIKFLESPTLLHDVCADLTTLGWIGEQRAKQLLYLAAISRLLPKPVWAVYEGSVGAAPWQGLGCIAALTPPEARTVFHRLHPDRESLRHHLLIVDRAETMRPEEANALRMLHERGGFGWAMTTAGGLGEARGPVAALAASTGTLDSRCADAFLKITVDESPAQTAAIISEQRRRSATGEVVTRNTSAAIIARHNAAQRVLERIPVRIPFADRVIFPSSHLRHRDEHAWFMGLVSASALLHQRQRERDDGVVLASELDFNTVVHCAAGLLAKEKVINPLARQLLTTLYAERLAHFTMADLKGLFPHWMPSAYRTAVESLLDFGHIESPEGGRGKQRFYSLVVRESGAAPQGGIRLRSNTAPAITNADAAQAVGDANLATVRENIDTNFTRISTGS